ncbi:T9SS type A sorting domain-containing protein [bacterium]|nr:T9SS type A sorting domain-containing protein [bacterium]
MLFRIILVCVYFQLNSIFSQEFQDPSYGSNLSYSAQAVVKNTLNEPVAGVQVRFEAAIYCTHYQGVICAGSYCYSDYKSLIGTTDANGVINFNYTFKSPGAGYSEPLTSYIRLTFIDQNYICYGQNYSETQNSSAKYHSTQFTVPFNLTNEERKRFLHYYSPIILKRSQEGIHYGVSLKGWDWLTSWGFDGDQVFQENGLDWTENLHRFIEKDTDPYFIYWNIRPTLYTSIIEFMENDVNGIPRKCLKLLYHPYQAIDKEGKLHDWEHIEVRVDMVGRTPGQGEQISYVIITTHKIQNGLKFGDPYLNFHETQDGKHVLIWRSQWDKAESNDPDNLNGQELQFVKDTIGLFTKNESSLAIVNVYDPYGDVTNTSGINGSGTYQVNFHYVFVDEKAEGATEFWETNRIDNFSASGLFSGVDKNQQITKSEIKRIAYELQDIADILPSMYHNYTNDWDSEIPGAPNFDFELNMSDPVYSEDGLTIEIPAHSKNIKWRARGDIDHRSGYVGKDWFWGSSFLFCDGCGNYEHNQHSLGLFKKLSNPDNTWLDRTTVTCVLTNDGPYCETGYPYALVNGWHEKKRGGFDGRWVQLFEDSQQSYIPYHLRLNYYPPSMANAKKNIIVTYGATDTIINSTISAGNSIIFKPGFKIKEGSNFRAYIDQSLNSATQHQIKNDYFLKSITDKNISNETVSKNNIQVFPDKFDLHQNAPNPFNPTTSLRYSLKEKTKVRLTIYNILGHEVRLLINTVQDAGYKVITWDGKNNEGKELPSGIYIYRLEAGQFIKSKKMLLLK